MNITFHIANDIQLCYFASIWQTCHLRKQFRKPMRFSFLISKMKMTIIKLISWACWRMKRVNVWNMLGTGPSTQYMYQVCFSCAQGARHTQHACWDFSMFLRTNSLENVQVETSHGVPFLRTAFRLCVFVSSEKHCPESTLPIKSLEI